MILVAGLAADVDALSLLGGAPAYLNYNRVISHSLVGSAVLAALVAAMFWWLSRKRAAAPLRFARALVASAAGAGLHLLLDLTNSYGVQLLWPFRANWVAWDLAEEIDPWILLALAAGLLLPGLFRLVSEEIGARPARRGRERATLVTLALVMAYFGARWVLHERALGMLNSRLYHSAAPLDAGAFPSAVSPLRWHGIVATQETLEELEVPLEPADYFDPDRSRTYFKPEPSAALEAARRTQTLQKFLRFARFPSASVERLVEGYRVTVSDLRFPQARRIGRRVIAVVELDTQARVILEEFRFAAKDK